MTITLPPQHADALREYAARNFDGNVSGAVRRLLEFRFPNLSQALPDEATSAASRTDLT